MIIYESLDCNGRYIAIRDGEKEVGIVGRFSNGVIFVLKKVNLIFLKSFSIT